MPVLHKDLSEETRVRQRYADLIVRQEARDMVRTKATALRAIRAALADETMAMLGQIPVKVIQRLQLIGKVCQLHIYFDSSQRSRCGAKQDFVGIPGHGAVAFFLSIILTLNGMARLCV